MSAQKAATGVAVAGLVAVSLSIGLPPLLPPTPVSEIVLETEGDHDPTGVTEPVPPGRIEDGAGADDGDGDDSPDSPDSPDDSD